MRREVTKQRSYIQNNSARFFVHVYWYGVCSLKTTTLQKRFESAYEAEIAILVHGYLAAGRASIGPGTGQAARTR